MPDPKRGEAATVEGRLADLIEEGEVRIDGYRLSDNDRSIIVKCLRDRARWMASDIHADERPGRKRKPG